jgi:hypothetical protein
MQSSFLERGAGPNLSQPGWATRNWHGVQVPTTVLNALVKNGVYPDPRVGLNACQIPDSSDEFNQKHDLAKYSHLPDKRNPWRDPWWFRREFTLPKMPADRRVWLHFDAINYRGDVWVNGRQIAEGKEMAGMFQRFQFDLTEQARTGVNALAVKVYRVDHPGVPAKQVEVLGPDRGYQSELMRDVTEIMTIGYPVPPPWQPNPEQREHLCRSLTLLSTSTPADRKTVRVLFYGQSITQQAWWKEVERYLRATYTNANLIVENRAIGGHASQLLVKTAEADLYPFQPDLLIFHVYGSHLEYENIIRRVRERTCADILLQTDHLTSDASLTEEADPAKLSPAQWDPWMNHVFLPTTASKYSACRADIHELWKAYLKAHQLKAADLLRDGVHLNAHGEWLMAELLKAYLGPLRPKAGYDPFNEPRVRTVLLAPSASQESFRLEFTGSRADLIFKPNAKAGLSVLVDGNQPSAIPELYCFTRVSAFPMSDWPVLLRVSAASPLVAEDWALKIDQASPDGKLCHFTLRGSVTGEDGEGSSTNRFVSKSGRIVIEPDDWNLAYSVAVFKRPLPENHTATWRAILRGTDTAIPPAASRGTEACVTLAQGLPPGRHVLELRGERVAEQIRAIRFYCPQGEFGKTAGPK